MTYSRFCCAPSQLAKAGCRCDYALYLGAASDNAAVLPSIASQAVGLKMYLNDTYSTLKMDNVSLWMEVRFAPPSIDLLCIHFTVSLTLA